MIKNLFMAIIVGLFLLGCVTTLKPEAKIIIDSDAKMVTDCKFIGSISFIDQSGFTVNSQMQNAKNKVLNQAAQKGTTNIVWGTVDRKLLVGGIANGKAYKCD